MNSSVCLLALLGILSYCSASYYSQYQGYKGYKKYTYSGKPNTYLDIYKNQGFQQEGSVVYYRKTYYDIKCEVKQFYVKLNACYSRYRGLKYCLNRLSRYGVLYKRVSYSKARKQSYLYGGHAVAAASAHAHAGIAFPWPIYKKRFSYNKKVYQLDCTQKNLYNKWNLCYKLYNNKDKCFGMLYGQKLFHIYVSASAHAHASSQGGNAVSSASAHAHAHAVISFPWAIYKNRFTYNKKVYQLDCTQKNLYDKWNLCYKHYYNKAKCFGMLYGQKLFHIYVSASAQAHAQSSSQGGNAASSASAHAHAHAVVSFPWTIFNNRFSYNKKVYQLDCTQQNLYDKWNLCYKHYYNKDKCFGMLYGQKLFHIYVSASAQAHAQSSSQGGNAASSASAQAHAHAVIAFPWTIYNNMFSYNKKVYQLDCTEQNLYNYWDRCYKHYYNKDKCFGMLYGQKLFHIYISASAQAHAQSSSQGGNAASSATAHAHAHAVVSFPWAIYNNRFTYNKKVYQLDCTQQNLYDKWNLCYKHYYNKDKCFGMLYGQKLFHIYVSASAHAHAHASSQGGNAVSSASAHAHAHAAIAFPWPIYKNKFVYNQKVYQLDIDKKDLYKHWNGCYLHHHDQHRCFGLLFNHKFFHLFNYASASAHATAHAASSG